MDSSEPQSPGHYKSSQTAVLLLDYHQSFVNKLGQRATEAAKTAERLVGWARKHNIQVLHCLLDLRSSPAPTCKDAGRIAAIAKATQEQEAVDAYSLAGDQDLIFHRRPGHVSALRSPGLLQHLRHHGIQSLLLAGLSTSGCVLRTSFAATDEDFVVTVVTDACADGSEETHDFVVGRLLQNRGFAMTLKDFTDAYEVCQAPAPRDVSAEVVAVV